MQKPSTPSRQARVATLCKSYLSPLEDAQRLQRLTGIGPPGLKNSGSAIGATSFAAWTSLAIVLAHSVAETLARKQSATRIGAKSFGCNKRRSASPR